MLSLESYSVGNTILDPAHTCPVHRLCLISHPFLSLSLFLSVPRAIVQWPLPEVLGTEGDRAQFDCVTTGQPQPVVIWFFQSTPVPKLPTSGAHDLGNGSLVIPVLQPHHSGTYFCMLREPPLDIHTFSLTVEARRRPRPSPAAPASPNIPLSTSPAQNTSSHSTHFTIGGSK